MVEILLATHWLSALTSMGGILFRPGAQGLQGGLPFSVVKNRNLFPEALAFFVAAMCLLLCSTGEQGSALVLSAAVMGRLCLDVCFTTVYVGLGAIFSGSCAKTALMICEATARLGGIIAPLSGTWPTSVSWLKGCDDFHELRGV